MSILRERTTIIPSDIWRAMNHSTPWVNNIILRCSVLVCVISGIFLFQRLTAHQQTSEKQTTDAKDATKEIQFFEQKVLPILESNCFRCHGEKHQKSGLRLDYRSAILKGGELGPSVSLTKPETSLLLKAISHKDEDLQMPPTRPLAKADQEVLIRWVKMGMPVTEDRAVLKESKDPRDYWAYKPIVRPEMPTVKNPEWATNPIDLLLLEQLDAKGLTPNPVADRAALFRRAYYDLLGLAPSPEEVQDFLKDKDPLAYEKWIDKMLASPQYGEKWGRHWLDVVRYAETNGYERDGAKPYVWRYRDYVVKAFNEDKPYSRFIREQIAGDEIEGYHPDAITATAFYRLGIWNDEPVSRLEARYNELDDIVATTSQVFLGMTMNCARCHDHKIDPIPQTDYYRLLAFFQDVPHYSDTRNVVSRFNVTDIAPPDAREKYEKELKIREGRIRELNAKMRVLEDIAIKKMPAEDQRKSEGRGRPQVLRKLPKYFTPEQQKEYDTLRRERDQLGKLPKPKQVMTLCVNNCTVPPPETYVALRGNPNNQGKRVDPGFPVVLNKEDPELPEIKRGSQTAGRRSVLVDWLTSEKNVLTARVMANRIWQFHFGRGIVPTSNDFGKFGERPTHPKPLDWLASELMSNGWSIKRMHKLIMTSSAYRMSSRGNDKALSKDPSNRLFWRFNARRLTAEEVRDSILAASGQLNLKMSGPSIYPKIPREVLQGQSRPGAGWRTSNPEESARRSIYVHVKRSLRLPILEAHDQPDSDASCAVRYVTTVPTQSLGMINGDFINESARKFAERLHRESPNDVEAQIKRAIWLTTSRPPTEAEVKKDVAFIRELCEKDKLDEKQALFCYCLLALNTNEFVYLD